LARQKIGSQLTGSRSRIYSIQLGIKLVSKLKLAIAARYRIIHRSESRNKPILDLRP
jgi:hypothetical protein